jgi:NADH:ubiquinone oxidoreductase subunit 6 (subunit J)
MPEGIAVVPFTVLAVAVMAGAIMVVFSRNVVHAAFWLLEVMMAVAGLFMLLSAGFLALVQMMVYAGAVSVLVLFTVMLTLRRR